MLCYVIWTRWYCNRVTNQRVYQITISHQTHKINNSTSTAQHNAIVDGAAADAVCSIVPRMHAFWIALRCCRKMARTYELRKESNAKREERTNENRMLMLAVFCDCFNFQRIRWCVFFLLRLFVLLYSRPAKIPAAAAPVINLLRYAMNVCVRVWNLFDLSIFIYSHFILIHAEIYSMLCCWLYTLVWIPFISFRWICYKYTFRFACISELYFIKFQQHLMAWWWHFCLSFKAISTESKPGNGNRNSFHQMVNGSNAIPMLYKADTLRPYYTYMFCSRLAKIAMECIRKITHSP